MSKKSQRLEWPSDSDLDELSIRSSELSDLDSDVDSLGSMVRYEHASGSGYCYNPQGNYSGNSFGLPLPQALNYVPVTALGYPCPGH